MQAALRLRQARPRADHQQILRRSVRQLGAFAGELLALASLAAGLAAGLLALTGLLV